MSNPFRYFNSSPEVIRLVVMMYVGAVTGTRNGGAKAGSFSWDSGCGRSPPHLERFVSEDSERGAGCEMALDIESVVDDGVSGEETLG